MRTLAEIYDVSLETVKDWERRGAPLQDPAALAGWVMNEPEIRAGYDRAQAAADRLPEMARRAAAAGDMAFATDALEALAGWLASPHCHALTVARLTGASCSGR